MQGADPHCHKKVNRSVLPKEYNKCIHQGTELHCTMQMKLRKEIRQIHTTVVNLLRTMIFTLQMAMKRISTEEVQSTPPTS